MDSLKLSDLDPNDIQAVSDNPEPLKLSQLSQSDIKPADLDLAPKEGEPSELGALGTLAAKGATAGLTGVAAGLGAAAGTYSGGKQDWESLKKAYQEALKANKSKEEAAGQKAGLLGTGVELASSIPAMVVGGGALKGLGMASKVAQGTTLGGATGLSNYLGNNASPTASGAAGATGIGMGLGTIGGAIGSKLEGATDPEALETAASKLASKSVGIKPSRELARIYDSDTGKVLQGSDIIKGIGSTAMEEGALPLTGGPGAIYDKTLDAIDSNYQKLNPLLQTAQQKLSQDPNALEAVGNLGDKTADFLYDFRDSLGNRSDQDKIMKGLDDEFIPYIQKLVDADGNLQQLNVLKRGLQDQATDLNAAAYDNPASDLKPKAEFVKRLGGIVRQQIEDLANQADPGLGDQIADTNKTLSNLYTYRDAAKKLLDKGQSSSLTKALNLPSQILTGNTTGRLAQMASAKVANLASQNIDTPAGQLVQKVAVNTPLSVITNPFTQGTINKSLPEDGVPDGAIEPRQGVSESSKLSTNLYNATDESLKGVADTLSKTPGLEYYADHLNRAIDTNDSGEKNRAIFLILQNPRSRELITPDKKLAEDKNNALRKFIQR